MTLAIENGIVFSIRVVGAAIIKESVSPVITLKVEETATQLIYRWVKFNPTSEAWEADSANTDPITVGGVEYSPTDGKITIPKIPENVSESLTIEEQLAQIKDDNSKLKADNLTIMEVLATIYEGMLEKGTV